MIIGICVKSVDIENVLHSIICKLMFAFIPYIFYRYKYLPNRRGGISGFGQAPSSRRTEAPPGGGGGGGRHAWGNGAALGGD